MNNKNYKSNKLAEDVPESEDFRDSGIKMYNDVDTINDVDAYIDEHIKAPGHYRNLLQFMRRMKEHDKLKIWLNSPGGYLNSALEIIEAMHNAEGTVQVVVSGDCASAATLIALSAPELIVQKNATMMLHAANYGFGGKMNEVQSFFTFNSNQVTKALWECYEGFLTREEFDKMIAGVDYYMAYDEIIARLEKRALWQKARETEKIEAEQ